MDAIELGKVFVLFWITFAIILLYQKIRDEGIISLIPKLSKGDV